MNGESVATRKGFPLLPLGDVYHSHSAIPQAGEKDRSVAAPAFPRDGHLRLESAVSTSHSCWKITDSLHFSPRGEAKCVRGPSGRGASRLARAGVLEQYVEHGKQAQRSPGGRIACFDRRMVRKAGWQIGLINLLSNPASAPPVDMHTPLRIGERRPEVLDPVPGLVLQGPFRNPRFRWLDSLGWII